MKFFEESAKSFTKAAKSHTKAQIKTKATAKLKENFETDFTFKNGVLLTTFRKNGEIVTGNKRNTIDTGETRDSITLAWLGDTLTVKSDSPDYVYVMYGFVTTQGRIVPGRREELFTL
jgi:hypothetical protein